MANLTPGYPFGSSETVTNTKLGTLVSGGSVSNIVNADIAAGAAIAYSKINFGGNISDGDISTSAAISYSKLSLATSIKNTDLAVGVGTSANNIVALDASAKLPAVDGSQLTNVLGPVTFASILDYGTSASSSTSKAQSALRVAYGTISVGSQTTQAITNLPFTGASSYSVLVTTENFNQQGIFTAFAVKNSGSQFTIYSNDNHTGNINWLCMGT